MKINHYLKKKAMKEKQLKLDRKIFKELFYFLSKVIGKKEFRIYVSTLNSLFKVNSTVKLNNILMNLKQAIQEDWKLYSSYGKELDKLIKSASIKEVDNVKYLLQIKNFNSNFNKSRILSDLDSIIFKIDKYEEYKNLFSELDYKRIILIIDLVIRENKQNKFKDNILKAIDSLIVFAGFSITELERSNGCIDNWTTTLHKVNSKAKVGGWAYVIDMKCIKNKDFLGHNASSLTTGLYSIETSASNSNQVRITKESDLSIGLEMIEEEYFREEYFRLEKGGYYDGLC